MFVMDTGLLMYFYKNHDIIIWKIWKGYEMKRAINFTLKNGKTVTIRPLKIEDYDSFVKYMKEFAKGPGAKWTWQYPGRPLPPKERASKAH